MIETTYFFPETLSMLPIWVLWRLEERNGRMTKVPYQINGRRASTTDPATWATYQEINKTWQSNPERYRGIGTVMSKANRTIFIDIDHCINVSGCFDNRAEDILSAFMDDDGNLTTFIEVSQSGTGLHLIVIGDIPRSFKNSRQNVEMYDNGRFIAMTGRAISACEPSESADGLRYVFEQYKTPSKAYDWTSRPAVDPVTRHGDDWIIDHAKNRILKPGQINRFPALFDGDISGYDSQSEADNALCCILAFWTDKDPESIDRIFRRSKLYRAKWERESYREHTIKEAISHVEDTLSEFTRRKKNEEGVISLGMLEYIRRRQKH